MPLCCVSNKAAPTGTINVLIGSNLHGVASELSTGLGGAQRLSESQKYLPGSTVPFPTNLGIRKIDYLAKAALQTASQGGNVVLTMEDLSNHKLTRLRSALAGTNLQVNTALVYPSAQLPALSGSNLTNDLKEFASTWVGEFAPTKHTVSQVSVSSIKKYLHSLPTAFGTTSADAVSMSKIAGQMVAQSLGLTRPGSAQHSKVYIRPRFLNFDMVVAKNTNKTVKTLLHDINNRSAFSSRTNLFVKPPTVANTTLCSSCRTSNGQHFCGVCTPKSLQNVIVPTQPLAGSRMASQDLHGSNMKKNEESSSSSENEGNNNKDKDKNNKDKDKDKDKKDKSQSSCSESSESEGKKKKKKARKSNRKCTKKDVSKTCYCDGWGDIHFNSPCEWDGMKNIHPTSKYTFVEIDNVKVEAVPWDCAPTNAHKVTCNESVTITIQNGTKKQVITGIQKGAIKPQMDGKALSSGYTHPNQDDPVQWNVVKDGENNWLFNFSQPKGNTDIRFKKGHWSTHNADYVNIYYWNTPKAGYTQKDQYRKGYCFNGDTPSEPRVCDAKDVTDEVRKKAQAACEHIHNKGNREACEDDYCANGPVDGCDPDCPVEPNDKCKFTLKEDTYKQPLVAPNSKKIEFWVKGNKKCGVVFSKDNEPTEQDLRVELDGNKIKITNAGNGKGGECKNLSKNVVEKDKFVRMWVSWDKDAGKIYCGRHGKAAECNQSVSKDILKSIKGYTFFATGEAEFRIPGGDCDPPAAPSKECYCKGWGDIHFESPCYWTGNKNYHPDGEWTFAQFGNVKVRGQGYPCAGATNKVRCNEESWIEFRQNDQVKKTLFGWKKDDMSPKQKSGSGRSGGSALTKLNGEENNDNGVKWTCKKVNDTTYDFTFDQPSGYTRIRFQRGYWNSKGASYVNMYVWNKASSEPGAPDQQLDGYCFDPTSDPETEPDPCADLSDRADLSSDKKKKIRKRATEKCKHHINEATRIACEQDVCAICQDSSDDCCTCSDPDCECEPDWQCDPCCYDLSANTCGKVNNWNVDSKYMHFWIKGKQGTCVLFDSEEKDGVTKSNKETDSYTITFGTKGNGKGLEIKKDGQIVGDCTNDAQNRQLTKENSWTPYWIAFYQGFLKVGHGKFKREDFNSRALCQYKDNNAYDVNKFTWCSGDSKLLVKMKEKEKCGDSGSESCDECEDEPPAAGNGIKRSNKTNGNKIGSKVTYTCDDSCASLSGSDTRVCKKDGKKCKWDDKQPKCKAKKNVCKANAPSHGKVSKSHADCKDTVKYECDKCYLGGPVTATCRSDGTFDKQPPTCTPDPACDSEESCTECDNQPPIAPANGSKGQKSNGDKIGSTVTYTCDDDCHKLQGGSTRKCKKDGKNCKWETTPPTCQAKEDVCSASAPNHGTVSKKKAKCNESVTYKCNHCFKGGPVTAKCKADGTWDKQPPTCVADPSCDSDNDCILPPEAPTGTVEMECDDPHDAKCVAWVPEYSCQDENGNSGWTFGGWKEESYDCTGNHCPGGGTVADKILGQVK